MAGLADKEFKSLSPTQLKEKPSQSQSKIFKPPSIANQRKKKKKQMVHIHGNSGSTDTKPTSKGLDESKYKGFTKSRYSHEEVREIQKATKKDNAFEDDLIKIDHPVLPRINAPERSSFATIESPTHTQIKAIDDSVDNEEEYNDVVQNMANGDVLQALQSHKTTRLEVVKQKYKNHSFPPPIASKRKIVERTEKHLHIIVPMLKGKGSVSQYYHIARKQQEMSNHETMSASEKWQIDWQQYHGGYIGFKRQSLIGNIINNRFQKNLRSAAKKNRTVSYWTTSAFSTYVLANEIIIRLAMEDMNCGFEKAQSILQQSADFGTVIADSVEVIDDMDIEKPNESEVVDSDNDVILIPSQSQKADSDREVIEVPAQGDTTALDKLLEDFDDD